jgi:photosystem II stability/assembly factor-like uncharacterized protein
MLTFGCIDLIENMMKHLQLLLLGMLWLSFSSAQHIELLQQGHKTSLRGLSIVDDRTAWISGSEGTVAVTGDGGKTWNWMQVKGFEKADFRDIEAFSSKKAIIMSSGTPALVLKTSDGGQSWQVKYRNNDSTYFFDAMDFAGESYGLILGDPVSGKFLLMETVDSGDSWHPFKNSPGALPGEAAFAASGTCLRVDSQNNISIVTGGSQSRWLMLIDDKLTPGRWISRDLPLLHGKSSQGAFSIADENGSVVVGGDYQKDRSTDSVAVYFFYTNQEHARGRLMLANKPPAGFQSSVEHISANIFLSTGTPGSNISTDGGNTWAKFDGTSFNVCRKAKNGKLVLLAGNGGKIGIFEQ